MSNRYQGFAIVSAVVRLCIALGALRAQAGDDKVFSATLCRGFAGGTPVSVRDNRLFNTGTTTLDVLCPLVRGSTLNLWLTTEVVGLDRHLTANVQGWAQSQNREGAALLFSAVRTTTPGRAGLTRPVLSLPWRHSLVECD